MMSASGLNPGRDVFGRRVFLDAIEDCNFELCFVQVIGGALRMARFLQAGVGDEQDAGAAEFAGQFAEAGECAGAEDHAVERGIVKCCRHVGTLADARGG